ncbi:MAG: BREX-6 system adenine-specific DNA-methyltransferase PglX [Planctomycetes bacterium]|nr:BREX-6 system adenine-specific DNA-methyltransferase PglX [Planctomycetota bacterium]
MPMTSDAKQALKDTVRSLRARLLADLHDATESVWQMGVRAQNAELDEATRATRATFEAWAAEQVRTQAAPATPARAKRARGRSRAAADGVDATATEDAAATATAAPARVRRAGAAALRTADDFRQEAEKLAAATLLNRLVMLRLLEAPAPDGTPPMRSPAVVTGGWESRGYRDFRELAPALVRGDATEGFGFLLRLVYADLAMELPGLYGNSGIADLVPIPPATLRHAIEALDDPRLASCWTDDMTLGWVYQYWNDPEREALDAKINAGGKIEPHEIASKTQLFTERYMVDWLLQNSLGPMWLAICKKQGWTPEVEADGTLAALEARRVEWRAKRDSGEVSLTDLMPLHTDAERRWAYYVPQPLSDDAVAKASESVRDLKIIDPAVGSGHFLVVCVGLLWAIYREEARHRGLADDPDWSDKAIVERILSYNLHGIDLDPRAVQIAAAALWLAGRQISREARPSRLNLVASNLRLASLPDDDPSLVRLKAEVERDIGMPGDLIDSIIQSLRGADSLGSLLRIDRAVDEAIARHEKAMAERPTAVQKGLFGDEPQPARQARIEFDATTARRSLLDRLESFLGRHTGSDDLGLRLAGEQLAAGVRFVRVVREGAYDLVVANPPYQDSSNLELSGRLDNAYAEGKRNLYSMFLQRGLELVRDGGTSAMLTVRDWMFIDSFKTLRQTFLRTHRLQALADYDRGAFEELAAGPGGIGVSATVWLRNGSPQDVVALRPSPLGSVIHDLPAKVAASRCHDKVFRCDMAALEVVPDWPLVYWWGPRMLSAYSTWPLLESVSPVRQGLATSRNARFLRRPHEVSRSFVWASQEWDHTVPLAMIQWAPFVKGGEGRKWIEPLCDIINWINNSLELKVFAQSLYGSYTRTIKSEERYFTRGVAFTKIGSHFEGRVYLYRSAFDVAGSSVFSTNQWVITCLLNSHFAGEVLTGLNPTVNFQVGDVKRLPRAGAHSG